MLLSIEGSVWYILCILLSHYEVCCKLHFLMISLLAVDDVSEVHPSVDYSLDSNHDNV